MAKITIINRNYVCVLCGKIRRAPAAYIPGAPPKPQCCGREMKELSYEQTVAATRLPQTKRVKWLAVGGKVVKATGKRRWKAVT